MPAPYPGGCSCGEIRYTIDSEPLMVYACHCTACQRSSGTAFTMAMLINQVSFSVTKGEPVPYASQFATGKAATGFMCSSCGTRLWRAGRKNTDLLFIRVGTLDQTSWLRPVAHLWTRSAQPWLALPKDAALYETQPDGWQELISLWQARNPAAGVGSN